MMFKGMCETRRRTKQRKLTLLGTFIITCFSNITNPLHYWAILPLRGAQCTLCYSLRMVLPGPEQHSRGPAWVFTTYFRRTLNIYISSHIFPDGLDGFISVLMTHCVQVCICHLFSLLIELMSTFSNFINSVNF